MKFRMHRGGKISETPEFCQNRVVETMDEFLHSGPHRRADIVQDAWRAMEMEMSKHGNVPHWNMSNLWICAGVN